MVVSVDIIYIIRIDRLWTRFPRESQGFVMRCFSELLSTGSPVRNAVF